MGYDVLTGLLPGASSSVFLFSTPQYDKTWDDVESVTGDLIDRIQPSRLSEEKRRAVTEYVERLIRKYFSCQVCTFGSVPLKTYLPDGDIDLATFSLGHHANDALANDLQMVLENEEHNKDAEFRVKEVQCIHAEVQIVKCLVDNIVVDISFNQLGGLCTLCFLEEVDQLIGRNHLFKRSIILIKAWCYYESRILGAHHGLISTYALETLVLYIFHVFHASLRGPLEVLFRFLEFFSQFDWEHYCLSLWGPIHLSALQEMAAEPPQKPRKELLFSHEFLYKCSQAYAVFSAGQDIPGRMFISKYMNVVDPLRINNNLGRSVSRGNFHRIRSAFAYGSRKLKKLLLSPTDDLTENLNDFFYNTRKYSTMQRPDAFTPQYNLQEMTVAVNCEHKIKDKKASRGAKQSDVSNDSECIGKCVGQSNDSVTASVSASTSDTLQDNVDQAVQPSSIETDMKDCENLQVARNAKKGNEIKANNPFLLLPENLSTVGKKKLERRHSSEIKSSAKIDPFSGVKALPVSNEVVADSRGHIKSIKDLVNNKVELSSSEPQFLIERMRPCQCSPVPCTLQDARTLLVKRQTNGHTEGRCGDCWEDHQNLSSMVVSESESNHPGECHNSHIQHPLRTTPSLTTDLDLKCLHEACNTLDTGICTFSGSPATDSSVEDGECNSIEPRIHACHSFQLTSSGTTVNNGKGRSEETCPVAMKASAPQDYIPSKNISVSNDHFSYCSKLSTGVKKKAEQASMQAHVSEKLKDDRKLRSKDAFEGSPVAPSAERNECLVVTGCVCPSVDFPQMQKFSSNVWPSHLGPFSFYNPPSECFSAIPDPFVGDMNPLLNGGHYFSTTFPGFKGPEDNSQSSLKMHTTLSGITEMAVSQAQSETMCTVSNSSPEGVQFDILRGDMLTNLLNLHAGRWILVSQNYGPLVYAQIPFLPFNQELFSWEGPGRCTNKNANMVAHAFPYQYCLFPDPSMRSFSPQKPYPMYRNSMLPEIPKFHRGTGTYLPNTTPSPSSGKQSVGRNLCGRNMNHTNTLSRANSFQHHGMVRGSRNEGFRTKIKVNSHLDRNYSEKQAGENVHEIRSSGDPVEANVHSGNTGIIVADAGPSTSRGTDKLFHNYSTHRPEPGGLVACPQTNDKVFSADTRKYGLSNLSLSKRSQGTVIEDGNGKQHEALAGGVHERLKDVRLKFNEKMTQSNDLQPSPAQCSYLLKDEDFPPLQFCGQRRKSTAFDSQDESSNRHSEFHVCVVGKTV